VWVLAKLAAKGKMLLYDHPNSKKQRHNSLSSLKFPRTYTQDKLQSSGAPSTLTILDTQLCQHGFKGMAAHIVTRHKLIPMYCLIELPGLHDQVLEQYPHEAYISKAGRKVDCNGNSVYSREAVQSPWAVWACVFAISHIAIYRIRVCLQALRRPVPDSALATCPAP
jgi:hypothetical protein